MKGATGENLKSKHEISAHIQESCREHGAAEGSRRDEDSGTPQPGPGGTTEKPVIPGAGCGAVAGPGPRVSLRRSDRIGEAVREELEHSAL